jgi:hypothetical protein
MTAPGLKLIRRAVAAALALGPLAALSPPPAQAGEAAPTQSQEIIKCCVGRPVPHTCVKLFGGDDCDDEKAPARCPSEDSPPHRCQYLIPQ